MPNPLKCGSYSKRLQEVELWMSAGKTSSSLHNHEDHVLHCNLFGRNDFIVMENKYKNDFNYQEKVKTNYEMFWWFSLHICHNFACGILSVWVALIQSNFSFCKTVYSIVSCRTFNISLYYYVNWLERAMNIKMEGLKLNKTNKKCFAYV